MITRRVLAVLCGLSVVGAVWAAILIICLLAGVRLLPIAVAGPIAAALVVPGSIVSVLTNASISRGRRARPTDFLRVFAGLPRWALAIAAVLFFAFWLAAMTAAGGLGGNAEIDKGRYVLNQHGSLTIVDKAAYDRELDHEERFMLGVLGGFGVAGAVLLGSAVARTASGDQNR